MFANLVWKYLRLAFSFDFKESHNFNTLVSTLSVAILSIFSISADNSFIDFGIYLYGSMARHLTIFGEQYLDFLHFIVFLLLTIELIRLGYSSLMNMGRHLKGQFSRLSIIVKQ